MGNDNQYVLDIINASHEAEKARLHKLIIALLILTVGSNIFWICRLC